MDTGACLRKKGWIQGHILGEITDLEFGTHGSLTPRAENAKINVTDEPYFGTQIVCNYLPFSKAAKGAQGGPQQ